MSTSPAPIRAVEPAVVTVEGGVLRVHELSETDGDVVRVIGDADDPVAATRHCLHIGARAVLAANAAVDVEVVERSFDALALRLDQQVTGAVTRIGTVAEELLGGEGGALPAALDGFHERLDSLLGSTFDPDSKASVLSTIEALVEETNLRAVEAVRRLVAPEGEDNPLARLKGEILSGVKGEIVDVVREIRDVSEKLGVAAARDEAFEQTAVKGFAFEDRLDASVGALAAQYGDVHERCGTEPGATGSKVGDEVVTLNAEDTCGFEARFVFEAKDRKVPMRRILDELDAAMENRDALCGVAVFRGQEAAPTSVPFHHTGDKAVVVLDDDGGDHALRLAYLWARMTVRTALAAEPGDGVDVDRLNCLVGEARRALEMLSTIKRCHSTARKAIEQAGAQAAELVEHVRAALDQLDTELRAPDQDAGAA
jgi:hypothetical protein